MMIKMIPGDIKTDIVREKGSDNDHQRRIKLHIGQWIIIGLPWDMSYLTSIKFIQKMTQKFDNYSYLRIETILLIF